jgi:hypothetical protein
MSEQEWLTWNDPTPMLECLRGRASDRKLRLFAVACCRRIWVFITDPGSQAVVEITEQSADGPVDVERILSLNYDRLTDNCGEGEEPFQTAFMFAGHVGYSLIAPFHGFPYSTDEFEGALETAKGAVYTMAVSHYQPDDNLARFYDAEELLAAGRQRMANAQAAFLERQATERVGQCLLLRDIFGPLPFRPLSLNPTCQTPKVMSLAQVIYDDRTFDRLPELAEALHHAECDNEEVLSHLRGPGPHVRGCWALDVVLGKE